MSSSAAATRASALASAAVASARSSRTGARASRFSLAPRRAALERNGAGHQEEVGSAIASTSYLNGDGSNIAGEQAELSSRQKRLSRAARYGAASSNQEPVRLPSAWSAVVTDLLDREGNSVLRRDYDRQKQGLRPGALTPQRSMELHLTTASPKRFAAARTVLKQVRNRLGRDTEDDAYEDLDEEWTPESIAEYGSGAGEGLWACAEVFVVKAGDGKLQYEGFEGVTPWQRVATDIIDAAKASSAASLTDGGRASGGSSEDDTLAKLSGMQIAFHPVLQHSKIEGLADSSIRRKLVFCNHYLSALRSDAARSDFVNSLWARHPDAEVLAFVEEGTQRGFACIASAREELLGIGRRSVLATLAGEQGATPQPSDVEACYVVAPCPHDRPCPLLHDYELGSTLTSNVGRSIQASSPMFHGSSSGLLTCTSPLRVHNPTYTRLTRGAARANDFVQHSYLIVRRGQRPTLKAKAYSSTSNAKEAQTLFAELQAHAARSKEGVLDELRQSKSTAENIPLAEIVSEVTESSGGEDQAAQAELLRMLPEILRQQGRHEGEEGKSVDEAMRMAQSVMEQSANLAAVNAGPTKEQIDQWESVAMSSDFLDQQRGLAEQQTSSTRDEMGSMRIESYQWPRLVRTPLKKGGHVIFDACTAQGSIDRFTLTRSMGRQTYQDARKASHGDLLPYMPLSEEPSLVGIDDEAAAIDAQIITHVQNVKALVTSVPAADMTQRNGLPPSVKIGGGKRNTAKRSFPWPSSSAQAIGPDLIVGGGDSTTADVPGASSRRTPTETFSRRTHYKGGQGRGAEQLRSAKAYSPRESRKRSMESYREEVTEGWTAALPGEEGVATKEYEEEESTFRS